MKNGDATVGLRMPGARCSWPSSECNYPCIHEDVHGKPWENCGVGTRQEKLHVDFDAKLKDFINFSGLQLTVLSTWFEMKKESPLSSVKTLSQESLEIALSIQ